MIIDEKLQTEKITPELIDYIVEKIVHVIQPEKIILFIFPIRTSAIQ